MKIFKRVIHLFYIALFILVCLPPSVNAKQLTTSIESGAIAHISDIHFDPFYDPTLVPSLMEKEATEWEAIFEGSKVTGYGATGSDSNFNLMKSALSDMADKVKQGRKLDFIVFTGDYLCHNFNTTFQTITNTSNQPDKLYAFIKKDFQFMVLMFNKYFPKVPVYISLGNNDSYEGDYLLEANGAFLKDTADIFAQSLLNIKDKASIDSFNKTYRTGGYYAIKRPASNRLIISLSTAFFSPNSSYASPGDANDPAMQQLAWLEAQLQTAQKNKQKVWLITHITPGDNAYGSLKSTPPNQYENEWRDIYIERFTAIMTRYSSLITAGFGGHTHMDDYRILLNKKSPNNSLGFFRIGPAVSPIFGNNPAYQLMSYDNKAYTLKDLDVFYLNMEASNPVATGWSHEYTFSKVYKQSKVTSASLAKVFLGIQQPGATQNDYMLYYSVSDTQSPQISPSTLPTYLCTFGFWNSEFSECMSGK